MRPEDRERIQLEVTSRVLERHMALAATGPDYLATLINDTIYHERRRLERDPPKGDEASFYAGLAKRLPRASQLEHKQMLEEMLRRFAAEVVGNFDERVYRLSTSVVPTGLSLLLKASSAAGPRDLLSMDGISVVRDHIEVQGEVEHVKSLLNKGTLMVVPTHSSHLDSIVLGYAAHLLELPPLLYGAGLNLFTNPLISFFMNNLGAYRVDRKKSASIYKEVLKEYATVALEMGYHNLFFPGGTRSRSGSVESHLKKGLLGTSVTAYVNNLKHDRIRPNVYIVPCTISYDLVLEAETLIDDHLKEMGKSRYIIEDDEFSKPRRILNFMSEIASLDGRIAVTFAKPLDIVGNYVDLEGRSLDPRGRVVETKSYVLRNGVPEHDHQRDQEYTQEIADAVVRGLRRNNVVMSTNIVAFSLMRMLRQKNPNTDLYRLLRTGGNIPSFPHGEVVHETAATIDSVNAAGQPRLAEEVRAAT
ncbi:MAG: 1-acyl-sn-glycerol-3-phosphate acyltransferase, partial [Myxococcales bacterium]|nr:1-acyl-sn-glycerol-3-phosphate acyltransferase [Myxococcales bacterium]